FRAGRLAEAVAAANAAVRKAPAELAPRVLLAELLLFAGNPERADVVLDAGSAVDPQAAIVIAEFRQLLRADLARRQQRHDGRVPEFLGEPTAALAAILKAYVALRAGDPAEATALAGHAEALRPRVSGTVDGVRFDDFRDADDLHAGYFEVLTTTGKYFWIPTERVETIQFEAPKRARDLYWRRVTMSVRDGPDGVVYLPVIYGEDGQGDSDELRLGRATDWIDDQVGPVRGVGQRVFLAGEELVSIMDVAEIVFDPPKTGA
ncbi:MAG: type secretion system protein ImpE, partial [Acetobacteraceae bacterium]|nr:type secretion system protein ImpE [Acetobacteraceae bacterium]